MLAFVIFAVTFLVVLIFVVAYLYPGSSKPTTVPGLDPFHPTDGNIPDIGKAGSLHEFLLNLHDEFGSIASFWMGKELVISLASPELFKAQSNVFDRPACLFELFEPLITSDSIQFANGAEGRARRQAYNSSYTHQAMDKYYPIFQQVVDELADKWATIPKAEHIGLSTYMFSMAIKGIARTSFGDLFTDDREVLKLKHNYDLCWHEMESRLLGEIPDADRQKKFDQAKAEMYALLAKAVDHRKKSPPEGSSDVMLIDAIIESGASDSLIAADCMTYLVGGLHTSGLLMTWALYFLATHPEVQEKLYQEIKQTLGQEEVSPHNINDLTYMRQVLDETLRCSVLAPYAARFQEFDIELGGHKIPAKTPVLQALGVVLQDEQLWPEPNRFDPDRFNPENSKKIPHYAFQPFGFAGKRKCPGYRFAYTEVTVVLTTVLRRFRVEMVPGQVVIPVHGLVTSPKDEIWITTEKRKD